MNREVHVRFCERLKLKCFCLLDFPPVWANLTERLLANDETAALLQKITDYTQQSMEAMDDIVWVINTCNDRFENIMARMRALAAEFSETLDCSLNLDFDENLNNLKLNMEVRKNLFLIYKEAINNIAKYAECKDVWISLHLVHNRIILKIFVDGKGFNVQNIPNDNGLINMRKRAEKLKGNLTVRSNINEGTSIELSFRCKVGKIELPSLILVIPVLLL